MAIKTTSFKDWNIKNIISEIWQSDIKTVLYFFSPAFEKYEPHKEITKAFPAEEIINPDEYLGLIFFNGLCLGKLIVKEFSLEQDFNMAFVGGTAADELTFTKTLVGVGDRLSPEMNGYEAVKILKSKPETKNVPVVFLTESTGSNDEGKDSSFGAAGSIAKPFDSPALFACVEKYL